MDVDITIDNMSNVYREISKIAGKQVNVAFDTVRLIGEQIYAESLLEVPVLTGTLKDSAIIEVHETLNNIESIIGYGGPDSKLNPITLEYAHEYAEEVHELVSVAPKSGKRKFLEDPARKHFATVESRVANAMEHV